MNLLKHREITAKKLQRCQRLHELLNSDEPFYPREIDLMDIEYRKLCYEIDSFVDRVYTASENN